MCGSVRCMQWVSRVVAARSDASGFCFRSLGAQFIVFSGCKERFHAETTCVGVDEKVILILLENTLGAVKFCCCGCRNAPSRETGCGRKCSTWVCSFAEGCGHFGWSGKESDGQWN